MRDEEQYLMVPPSLGVLGIALAFPVQKCGCVLRSDIWQQAACASYTTHNEKPTAVTNFSHGASDTQVSRVGMSLCSWLPESGIPRCHTQ